jgi:polyhydroxyalkanoate synthesis regulator protein
MFAPFARREGQTGDQPAEPDKAPPKGGDIDDLKRQLDEMQRKIDRLSDKDKSG